MAEVTISPELMNKLSAMTKLYIKLFYDHHEDSTNALERCHFSGIYAILHAQENMKDAEHAVINDAVKDIITKDEAITITSILDDFNDKKKDEFLKALEKCGCKFKY